jgi:hypothetical protein
MERSDDGRGWRTRDGRESREPTTEKELGFLTEITRMRASCWRLRGDPPPRKATLD